MAMRPFSTNMECPACGEPLFVYVEPPVAQEAKVFWIKFPEHGECELSGKDFMVDDWAVDGRNFYCTGFRVT